MSKNITPLSPYRREPSPVSEKIGDYVEHRVTARVNRHEPEIVYYLIDAGMKFILATSRTGIGTTISSHRTREHAETKALRLAWKEFPAVEAAAAKRVTLYG